MFDQPYCRKRTNKINSRNQFKCFGIHCIAKSRYLLEIKYSDVAFKWSKYYHGRRDLSQNICVFLFRNYRSIERTPNILCRYIGPIHHWQQHCLKNSMALNLFHVKITVYMKFIYKKTTKKLTLVLAINCFNFCSNNYFAKLA